jgi:hypothetical protein
MTDIEVRSCVVRVVRRGAWSWGPDPPALLDDVLAAMPALIADALAEAVPAGADGEVSEPVRVSVPLRRMDLHALSGAKPGVDSLGPGPALASALRDALSGDRIIGAAHWTGPSPEDDFAVTDIDSPRAESAAAQPDPPGPAILQVLLSRQRAGLLGDLLQRLPVSVLSAWHDSLLAGWGAEPRATPDSRELASILDEATLDPAGSSGTGLEGWLRARLAAITVVAARTGAAPGNARVLAALDARFGGRPLSPAATPSGQHASAPGGTVPSEPAASDTTGTEDGEARMTRDDIPDVGQAAVPAQPVVRHAASRVRPARAVRVGSALPFLILVPLSRIGWIDALAAGTAATGLTGYWPSLAAALAFTVLAEPEDGWRRSAEDLATAAVFASVAPPFVETALPQGAELLTPALDAVLGRSLADGHRSGDPLVLLRAGAQDGLVLLEGAGLFPMAWADDRDGLAGWAAACPGSRVVAGPGAGAMPALGEVAPGDAEPGDRVLVERASLVLAGLRSRRASPSACTPTLERSLTLAAGAALASIAWTLWGTSEETDPLLALERLASLDAVVHDDTACLRVVLPLGARYFALHHHGLLGEVPGVPWLGGRSIEVLGG